MSGQKRSKLHAKKRSRAERLAAAGNVIIADKKAVRRARDVQQNKEKRS